MIEEGLRREVGVFRGGLNGARIGILLSDQFQLPVAALRELIIIWLLDYPEAAAATPHHHAFIVNNINYLFYNNYLFIIQLLC